MADLAAVATQIRDELVDAVGDEDREIALAVGIGGLVAWALMQPAGHPARDAVLHHVNQALASGQLRAESR